LLQELPVHQRADAVSSLVYEAHARVRDPVYGCVGAISYLQNQVSELQMQLAVAQAEILCIQMQQEPAIPNPEMEDPDQKSYLLQNELPQYLNYASSSNVIYDSLSRESIFGHDMVSWMQMLLEFLVPFFKSFRQSFSCTKCWQHILLVLIYSFLYWWLKFRKMTNGHS